jgi:oligoendopeptidase F
MTTTTQDTGAEGVAWDLSDLYDSPDDEKLQGELDDAKRATTAFRERYRGKVAELDAAGLADAVAERERIESLLDRPMTYAQLRFSTNMADPPRGALVQRIQEESAALSTEVLFFGLEWADVDDEHAERVLADEAIAEYRHWLEALRRYRPHLLTEPEERIMTEKSVSGSSSWSRLYSELLAGLRAELDGEEQSMELALARLQDADRAVRRTSAEAITEGLQPGLRTRAFVFNSILLDKSIDDRLRGYPTWISSRNLANEVSDDAVQALVDAVVSRYDVPQRYYRLKARLLGLDRLAHYDRVAPFSEETSFTTWDEARRIVVDAFGGFSAEAGEIVDGFFARSWIDAPVRPDKSNGAFCATTVPGVHPYVLMNFTGSDTVCTACSRSRSGSSTRRRR